MSVIAAASAATAATQATPPFAAQAVPLIAAQSAPLLAVPCGLVVGLLLGALGGGGSILAVPALVYLLGQSPRAATTGALVVVAIGSVSGLVGHARAGRVRWAAGATFGVLGIAGTYLGSRWSAGLDPDALMTAFAGLMLAVATTMLLRTARDRAHDHVSALDHDQGHDHSPGRDRAHARAAPPPPADPTTPTSTAATTPASTVYAAGATPLPRALTTRTRKPRTPRKTRTPRKPGTPLKLPAPLSQLLHRPHTQLPTRPLAMARRPAPSLKVVVTATAVGLLTGFLGVGGGFVVVPALTLVLGLEMPVAVGTSLLVILLNSLSAFASRAQGGGFDWPLLVSFAGCAALGSCLGNGLTTRLRPRALSTAFASLVAVLALSMAANSIPHL